MMKTVLLILLASIASMFMLSNQSKQKITAYHALKSLRTNGAITSMTGAPGESNCTSCHGGGTLDGNNGMNEMQIVGVSGNEYTPGETVTMQFEMTDGSDKNGFQLVALHTNDQMAGEFSITNGNQTQLRQNLQLERDYVTHTSGGTSESSWTFDWVTPATGGEVTFYVASNKSSNIGSSGGAQIYLSQHTFTAEDLTNTTELSMKPTFDFDLVFQKNANKLILDYELTHGAEVFINVVDMKGTAVYSTNLGRKNEGSFKEVINLAKSLDGGIYITTLFFDNQPVSKKFMVN